MLYSIAVEACKSLVDWNPAMQSFRVLNKVEACKSLVDWNHCLTIESWKELRRGLQEPRGLKSVYICNNNFKRLSRLARASWIEIPIPFFRWLLRPVEACKSLVDWNIISIVMHWIIFGRGLQEPRGLKLLPCRNPISGVCRGLQEPRGLKCYLHVETLIIDSRGLQEPHTLRYTASHTYNKNGGNR